MTKFDITISTRISKVIELEAEDYEAAIKEVRRMYEAGELNELEGHVRVEADDAYHENWHEIGSYDTL